MKPLAFCVFSALAGLVVVALIVGFVGGEVSVFSIVVDNARAAFSELLAFDFDKLMKRWLAGVFELAFLSIMGLPAALVAWLFHGKDDGSRG